MDLVGIITNLLSPFFFFFKMDCLVLLACLEVKKRRGSRVEGGRVIQLPYLEVF